MEYTNVSNPAAFAVEWQAGSNGNTFQLINPRKTTELLFSVRHAGQTRWSSTPVCDPTRWLPTLPRSYRAFLEAVQRYVEG